MKNTENWQQSALTYLKTKLEEKKYNLSWLCKRNGVWFLKKDLDEVCAVFVLMQEFQKENISHIVIELAFQRGIPLFVLSGRYPDFVLHQLVFEYPYKECWIPTDFRSVPSFVPYSVMELYTKTYHRLDDEYRTFKRVSYVLATVIASVCILWGVGAAWYIGICCACFLRQLPYIAGGLVLAVLVAILPWFSVIKISTNGITLLRNTKGNNRR